MEKRGHLIKKKHAAVAAVYSKWRSINDQLFIINRLIVIT